MITLLRNRRKLYVCNAYFQNNIKLFNEPIELYENYQVTNNDAEIGAFGMEAYKKIRIKSGKSHAKYYKLGDRVFINVTPPKEHDPLCSTADYEVIQEPIETYGYVEVMLQKRSGVK